MLPKVSEREESTEKNLNDKWNTKKSYLLFN